MNDTQIFTNDLFGKIRVLETGDGKILFCGKDVAIALGYKVPKDAISAHCKGAVKYRLPTNGGLQEMVCIPEGDLYRLITHSKLPEAEKFESWIFDDVLPAIRKTGSYAVQQKQDSYTITDPIKRAERWIEEQKEKQALEDTVAVQAQQIAELQPKANYCDVVLRCNGTVPISVIAKDYGKSAVWLNRYLHEANVQYKQNGTWLLYQKYAACGYTKTSTITDLNGEYHVHTKWTQKGRLFIYDLLKNNGVLPLIELDA